MSMRIASRLLTVILWKASEWQLAAEVPVQDRRLGLGLTSGVEPVDFRNDSALDPVFWLIQGSERRQAAFRYLLRPILGSLPHDTSSGTFSASASATDDILFGPNSIRYALHRVFVQKHGWQIRGLEPNSVSKPGYTYSKTSVVHAWLQAFLARHHGQGMTLSDAAALAATIEEHVHEEALRRSHRSFDHYAENDGLVREDKIAYAITMAKSPVNDTATNEILTKAAELVDKIVDLSQDSIEWEEVKFYVWLRDVQFRQAYFERNSHNPFDADRYDFDFMLRVVDEIGDEHGRWQDQECQVVKSFLVGLDKRGLGRVPLQDFYNAQLEGAVPPPFRFIESQTYLKHLGALDDTTDPTRPSVIVPNYINARSNCVASRDTYDICCIDECEALLGHVEEQIRSPDATPEAIASIVANLPSDSIQAPRELSATLLSRLQDVAKASGGRVPLHGRLFMQWMHYAYPFECAYPHAPSGDDNEMLQTADAWFESDTSMSDDEVRVAISRMSQRDADMGKQDDVYMLTEADLSWNDMEMSFTDVADDDLSKAAKHKFSKTESRRSRVSAALPAAVILVSGAASFLWWATSTLAKARRAVMPSTAVGKWNKDVLFT